MSNTASAFVFIGVVLAYWLPTIVAVLHKPTSVGSVVVVNCLLGWTGIGWVNCPGDGMPVESGNAGCSSPLAA